MADARKEEQRKHVVEEIVQTEATFVADLNVRVLPSPVVSCVRGFAALGLTIRRLWLGFRWAWLACGLFSW